MMVESNLLNCFGEIIFLNKTMRVGFVKLVYFVFVNQHDARCTLFMLRFVVVDLMMETSMY